MVSLNEDVLKRAIDREIERGKVDASGKEPRHAGTRLDRFEPGVAGRPESPAGARHTRSLRVSNADADACLEQPVILNEWKHRYPDQDPVGLHERYWQTRLICPGGGQYVWNEQWQTMESTVYGCPAAPKEGPVAAPVLHAIKYGNFGVTFEDQGLRAGFRWTADACSVTVERR